jgi:hypothetical protein
VPAGEDIDADQKRDFTVSLRSELTYGQK